MINELKFSDVNDKILKIQINLNKDTGEYCLFRNEYSYGYVAIFIKKDATVEQYCSRFGSNQTCTGCCFEKWGYERSYPHKSEFEEGDFVPLGHCSLPNSRLDAFHVFNWLKKMIRIGVNISYEGNNMLIVDFENKIEGMFLPVPSGIICS